MDQAHQGPFVLSTFLSDRAPLTSNPRKIDPHSIFFSQTFLALAAPPSIYYTKTIDLPPTSIKLVEHLTQVSCATDYIEKNGSIFSFPSSFSSLHEPRPPPPPSATPHALAARPRSRPRLARGRRRRARALRPHLQRPRPARPAPSLVAAGWPSHAVAASLLALAAGAHAATQIWQLLLLGRSGLLVCAHGSRGRLAVAEPAPCDGGQCSCQRANGQWLSLLGQPQSEALTRLQHVFRTAARYTCSSSAMDGDDG